MTVGELIALLQKASPTEQVVVTDCYGEVFGIADGVVTGLDGEVVLRVGEVK